MNQHHAAARSHTRDHLISSTIAWSFYWSWVTMIAVQAQTGSCGQGNGTEAFPESLIWPDLMFSTMFTFLVPQCISFWCGVLHVQGADTGSKSRFGGVLMLSSVRSSVPSLRNNGREEQSSIWALTVFRTILFCFPKIRWGNHVSVSNCSQFH